MAHICKYRKNKEFGKLYSEHGHESVRDGAPVDRQTDRPRSRSRRQQQFGVGARAGGCLHLVVPARRPPCREQGRGERERRGEERRGGEGQEEEEEGWRGRRRAQLGAGSVAAGAAAAPGAERGPAPRRAPTGQPPGAQGRGLQAAPMLPAWVKLVAEKAFPSLLPCSSWPCPTAGGGVRSCCCCHNQMG